VAECLRRSSLAQNSMASYTFCAMGFSRTLSIHSAENRYLALFRAWEDEGSEEEEWHPISVTPLPGQVDFLRAIS